ncbi:aldehyde dehydrogenase family protein [Aquihabitans sp. McL0605]|uniref:aldehyde dehydrogenase family protein n=1 Tax=Aquihabitans sp. McL0605 TaxID=3415671 RepID=UPI003CE961F3
MEAIDRRVPDVHLHIGDEQRSSGRGGVHQHICSATGEVQGPVPLAGADDVDDAVRAAGTAFETWRTWTPAQRRDVLVRLADLLDAAKPEMARLSVLDNGMTYGIAHFTATSVVDYARYYAGWADKIEGRVASSHAHGRELAYTLPEPYGVVGIIITWNGPLVSVGMKVLPALAAGNTVVIKPSELTPYAMEHFMALVRDAGIPAGVVNVLPGTAEAGEALVRHPLVQKISFTGGPTAARQILATCAETLKPAVLELGGKSACLVFPDADLEAVAFIITASVHQTLAGQGCALATRLLVHDSVYDEVVDRVIGFTRDISLGDPFDASTGMGPVVSRAAQERIVAMIARAQEQGAGKLLFGGGVPGGDLSEGFFVEPTVFGDVDPHSEIAQVEVFGPVLSIIRFHDEDEAIEIANGTSYGLASYLWTNDVNRINRLVPRLEAGGVYINGAPPVVGCELPFGGVGASGFGREGGLEGLLEFVRTKAVAIA